MTKNPHPRLIDVAHANVGRFALIHFDGERVPGTIIGVNADTVLISVDKEDGDQLFVDAAKISAILLPAPARVENWRMKSLEMEEPEMTVTSSETPAADAGDVMPAPLQGQA